MEAWISKIQTQSILPVNATAHRVRGCTVRQVFGKLHDRNEREAPGGFSGFTALRIEDLEGGLVINGPKMIAHLHHASAVGKGGPSHTGGGSMLPYARLGRGRRMHVLDTTQVAVP